MEKLKIRVDETVGSKPPLATISVGRGSSFECEIVGVPDGVQEVQMHFGRPGTNACGHATANPLPDGRWGVYANGLHFQDVGVTKYHVTGRDERDNSRWFGSGTLNVRPSVLQVDAVETIIPEDCYVRNPENGLWYKFTVTVEDGILTPVFSKEGITK